MPPLACNLTEKALPTPPVRAALVEVTVGAAGTVSVMVPVWVVFATEVAVIVIVCGALVAAGAVYVAEVVVVFDNVPPPLVTAQVTPALFWSLVTVPVRVTLSAPSTVEDEAVIAMLMDLELPPQPEKHTAAHAASASTTILLNTDTLRFISQIVV
jgi:hypothetical protein